MLRLSALVLLASAQGSRIQVHEQAKWGASCEDLQSRFHDRVAVIQTSLEELDDQTELSTTGQLRLATRMHGIIRTLRRASECQWVIDNNSDDLDQMRGVILRLLAGNPCAEAARLEMERGRSDESMDSITRAMGILMSDDCEAPEMPEVANNDEVDTQELLQEAEDELQDHFDELGTDGEGSAFFEAESQTFRGFMRGVGVFFLMVFLLLACVATAAAIGFALTWLVAVLAQLAFGRTAVFGRGPDSGWQFLGYLIMGTGGGFFLGIPTCAYQLYNHVYPRVTQ